MTRNVCSRRTYGTPLSTLTVARHVMHCTCLLAMSAWSHVAFICTCVSSRFLLNFSHFQSDRLMSALDKWRYITQISYGNKLICKALDTKFLGIRVDSTLSWKIHIEQIIPKLSAACYAVRSIKPFLCHRKH
jgi:hypothetical protein